MRDRDRYVLTCLLERGRRASRCPCRSKSLTCRLSCGIAMRPPPLTAKRFTDESDLMVASADRMLRTSHTCTNIQPVQSQKIMTSFSIVWGRIRFKWFRIFSDKGVHFRLQTFHLGNLTQRHRATLCTNKSTYLAILLSYWLFLWPRVQSPPGWSFLGCYKNLMCV